MRIKPSTSFPYPVLSETTGDYGEQKLQITLEIQETPSAGAVTIGGDMTLDDPSILRLIETGKAISGLMITCPDTYFDHFENRPIGKFSLDFIEGQVRGPVYIRGVIIAASNNIILDSSSIDAEFPPESRTVNTGDFIAFTHEHSFEAGLEKLTPLESIFKLRRHDEIKEGTFEVNLEDEAIEILAPPSLHQFLSLLREQPMKDTLLSSLYLPAVMSALEAMRDNGYSDKRWFSVIQARCHAEGIDIKNGDLVRTAQQLLDHPLGELQKTFERADR